MANQIEEVTISNQQGNVKATLINVGASVKNLYVLDKNGSPRDIVLGLPKSADYLDQNIPYFGCVVGRVAGRIKEAKFSIDGKLYKLEANNGPNMLHGGKPGFSHRHWTVVSQTENSVKFSLTSLHGDNGFPGSLQVLIEYMITDTDQLSLVYEAKLINEEEEKDIPATIINLTNHSYFNLSGFQESDHQTVLNHMVQSDCRQCLEKDDSLTANGNILDVETAPGLNFLSPKKIGDHIDQVGGYDDCYLVQGYNGNGVEGGSDLIPAITVTCPASGISCTMSTTEPAFQFYTGNFLSPSILTKSHSTQEKLQYDKHYGFCLEAQRQPNAVNVPGWEHNVILRRGNIYRQKTVYAFKRGSM